MPIGIVRLDVPDVPKRMWWERDGCKGLRGLSPSSFALYGIDCLDPMAGDDLVVVEGEKAADALRAIGIRASSDYSNVRRVVELPPGGRWPRKAA